LPLPQQRVKGIGPDGKAQIEMSMKLQNVRPIVPAEDEACAHYKSRKFDDVVPIPPRDSDVLDLPAVGSA
jgi:hypothetical protein